MRTHHACCSTFLALIRATKTHCRHRPQWWIVLPSVFAAGRKKHYEIITRAVEPRFVYPPDFVLAWERRKSGLFISQTGTVILPFDAHNLGGIGCRPTYK
jgi:hypothetical protein